MKNKFQRMGALLCACLIVFVGIFASFSVSAVSFDYPESLQPWLNESPLEFGTSFATFGLSQSGTYSLAANVAVGDGFVAVDSVYYSTVGGIPHYDFRFNGVTVGIQFSYPLVIELVPELTDPVLLQSVRYLYSSNYHFSSFVDQEFLAFVIYSGDSDITSGTFTSIWNNDDLQILFDTGIGEQLIVYSNGSWVDDFYKTPEFIVPLSRASFSALNDSRYIPSFLGRVTSGLTAVISWVGAVASAVISGPLSPLLDLVAVGIAVSAILLVIYLVRRFIWGA